MPNGHRGPDAGPEPVLHLSAQVQAQAQNCASCRDAC